MSPDSYHPKEQPAQGVMVDEFRINRNTVTHSQFTAFLTDCDYMSGSKDCANRAPSKSYDSLRIGAGFTTDALRSATGNLLPDPAAAAVLSDVYSIDDKRPILLLGGFIDEDPPPT
jgi:formylglycine-generating enzyme required for sulfatase activity